MECGKCSSRQAAILRSSSSPLSSKEITEVTTGSALVSVPVLSKTMVSAAATASKNLPPFTVIPFSEASLMADSTDTGMASFSAQEKSTISTESALVTLRVKRYTSPVPAKV